MKKAFLLSLALVWSMEGAALVVSERCLAGTEQLDPHSVDALLNQYLGRVLTTKEGNQRFYDRLKQDQLWGVLVIDTANLKWQNGYGIGNPAVVDASEMMYRQPVLERLRSEPEIAPYLTDAASDWKSLRLGFSEVPLDKRAAFHLAIDRVLHGEADRHQAGLLPYLGRAPESWGESPTTLNHRVSTWHSAGFACRDDGARGDAIGDLAGTRANFSRDEFTSDRRYLRTKRDNAQLETTFQRYRQSYREALAQIESKYGAQSPLLEIVDGKRTLSRQLVEILRKHPNEVKKFVTRRWPEVKLDESVVQNLLQAFTASDRFSPKVNQVERVVLTPMGFVVNIDFKAAGAKGQQLLMRALDEVEPKAEGGFSLEAILKSARQSEQATTNWLDRLRRHVAIAAEAGGVVKDRDDLHFSGDDGEGSSDQPFRRRTVDKREFYLRALVTFSGDYAPNQFRNVMVDNALSDTGLVLDSNAHQSYSGTFSAALHRMEAEYDPGYLNYSLGISPRSDGGGTVRLFVTGAKVNQTDLNRLQRLAARHLPPGYDLDPQPARIQYPVFSPASPGRP